MISLTQLDKKLYVVQRILIPRDEALQNKKVTRKQFIRDTQVPDPTTI